MSRLLFAIVLTCFTALHAALAHVPSVFVDTEDIRAGNDRRFGAFRGACVAHSRGGRVAAPRGREAGD